MTWLSRWFPRPELSLFLLALWLLLNNTVSPGHILLGAVFAWWLPLLTARFWPEHPEVKRYWPFLKFLGLVIHDIILANVTVAGLILFGRKRIRPGFIEIPLTLQSDFAITILASTISLTPGTVSTDLDDGRTRLLVHVLDLDDPQTLIDQIKHRYERRLQEIFE
ncbi:Na+/H+ antiporter subunit E [Marinobacteraceae bacterium S3BR75-40.1]